MKLIYKPFAIVIGLIAGLLANKAFERVWGAFTDEDPTRGWLTPAARTATCDPFMKTNARRCRSAVELGVR